MAECCERFVRSCLRNQRDRGTWFVASGRTGCGKTHCATKIRYYYDLWRITAWNLGWLTGNHIPAAVFVSWPGVCMMPPDVFTDWFQTEVVPGHLVIVDDFGAEDEGYRNGANDARLHRVLEACDPRTGKWFFGTSNIAPSEWARRYDQRISDRLLAGRFISMFDVPSYRVRKEK